MRAVFLDRDGVVDRAVVRDGKPYPPDSAREVEIPPDVPQALRDLKQAGFLLLVVTNQPDVARGTQQRSEVEAIHAVLRAALPIDDFLVCYHDEHHDCGCRKPKPGMLMDAAATYGLDLSASYLVGDRWRDIDAGHAAGCTTVWIDRGYDEKGPTEPPAIQVQSLGEAVAWILKRTTPGGCGLLPFSSS